MSFIFLGLLVDEWHHCRPVGYGPKCCGFYKSWLADVECWEVSLIPYTFKLLLEAMYGHGVVESSGYKWGSLMPYCPNHACLKL